MRAFLGRRSGDAILLGEVNLPPAEQRKYFGDEDGDELHLLFYGEEIGMGENLDIDDRLAVRTPMQWNGDPSVGFSSAPADALIRAITADPQFAPSAVNVRDQRRDPDSLLNWFERLIRLRKELPEVGWGTREVLETGNPAVLALRHDWEGRTLITAHNLKPRTAVATIEFDKPGGVTLRELLGESDTIRVRNGRAKIRLGPHEQRWLRLVT